MNRKEQKRRQAFLDDIHALEKKHGYQIVIQQAEPVMTFVEMPEAEEATAAELTRRQTEKW